MLERHPRLKRSRPGGTSIGARAGASTALCHFKDIFRHEPPNPREIVGAVTDGCLPACVQRARRAPSRSICTGHAGATLWSIQDPAANVRGAKEPRSKQPKSTTSWRRHVLPAMRWLELSALTNEEAAFLCDRQAHNLKVVGSNPTPATKSRRQVKDLAAFAFCAYVWNPRLEALWKQESAKFQVSQQVSKQPASKIADGASSITNPRELRLDVSVRRE
jgi:hypothetical protein